MAQPRNNDAPRKVITFKQLLGMAHNKGVQKIVPELIRVSDDGGAMFKALVVMKDGTEFVGHGEATKENTKPAMHNCIPRIAETRAVVRALKLAVNMGDVAAEELEDYDATETAQPQTNARKPAIDTNAPITAQQAAAIANICKNKGRIPPDTSGWTQQQAAECIAELNKKQAA